jgi:hypothetical protein
VSVALGLLGFEQAPREEKKRRRNSVTWWARSGSSLHGFCVRVGVRQAVSRVLECSELASSPACCGWLRQVATCCSPGWLRRSVCGRAGWLACFCPWLLQRLREQVTAGGTAVLQPSASLQTVEPWLSASWHRVYVVHGRHTGVSRYNCFCCALPPSAGIITCTPPTT